MTSICWVDFASLDVVCDELNDYSEMMCVDVTEG